MITGFRVVPVPVSKALGGSSYRCTKGSARLISASTPGTDRTPSSQRLATIPGVGPVTASALAASIADPEVFKSGREMAAWIGLVPRQNSTGGKQGLGKISKQGDQYLRWLLFAGAMTVVPHAKRRGATHQRA